MIARCHECMEPLGSSDICPKCGFDNSVDNQKIKIARYLKNRYYIGNVFSKSLDSVVYLAYDEELDKKVFVREFNGEELAKLGGKYTVFELRQIFLSYAKSTATITMCDILPHTIDVFDENESAYLVTDYFDGESLKTLFSSGINIGSAAAFKMVKQLLNGLKLIHNSGMIFGAISPETIYVLKNGEIRLFGIASSFYNFLEDVDSRVEVLNPSYAAPELFSEMERKGPYTDVYSVAAIFYRLLTNKIPAISFLRSGGENLIPPKKVDKNISKNTETALLNALNWQIENRTATPKRFLKELSSEKVKRRLSAAIIWADVLGFFQSVYDEFLARKLRYQERKPKTEKNQKQKRKLLWVWITVPVVLLLLATLVLFVLKFSNGFDTGENTTSTLSGNGEEWYYGSGIETPTNSSKYVYGGHSSKKQNSSKIQSSSSENLSSGNKESSGSSKEASSEEDANIVECPRVIGIPLEQVKKALEGKELLIGEIAYEESVYHYPDYVIKQNPARGEKVEKGSKINLVVCKAAQLPDVAGLSMSAAKTKLAEEGFKNTVYKFAKSDKAVGSVTQVYFETKTNQTKTGKVAIVVSGEEAAPIFNYSGKTVAEAKAISADVKLVFALEDGADISGIADADLDLYKVVSQDVSAGSSAYMGMTVTLTVALP